MIASHSFRTTFIGFLAIALASFILTGCGEKEEKPDKTENSAFSEKKGADELRKGDEAYEAGDYEAAEKHYMSAAQKNNPEAKDKLAKLYGRDQGIEKARMELANANSIPELEAVIAKHPTHKFSDDARLRLAALLIASEKKEDLTKAREQLLAVANSPRSESFIRVRAALDAASIIESLGQKEDAAKEYETLANRSQGTPADLRVEAAYSAARIFASLDRNTKADAMLKLINLNAPETGFIDQDKKQPATASYVFWASRAKFLNEKMHPSDATVAIPGKPAEASLDRLKTE